MDERNTGEGVHTAFGSPGVMDMTWLYGACNDWTLEYMTLLQGGRGEFFRKDGRVYYRSLSEEKQKIKQPRTA